MGTELLVDAFEQVRDGVHPAANGLTPDELTWRPDAEANSIAWLVWHLTRVQDDQVAALSGRTQAWTDGGWLERFALPLDPADTGYGHDPGTVGLVTADARTLLDYFEDVHGRTLAYLDTLDDAGLARQVDGTRDPAVTVGGRLVAVVVDDLQHVGQAAYVRGLLQRR